MDEDGTPMEEVEDSRGNKTGETTLAASPSVLAAGGRAVATPLRPDSLLEEDGLAQRSAKIARPSKADGSPELGSDGILPPNSAVATGVVYTEFPNDLAVATLAYQPPSRRIDGAIKLRDDGILQHVKLDETLKIQLLKIVEDHELAVQQYLENEERKKRKAEAALIRKAAATAAATAGRATSTAFFSGTDRLYSNFTFVFFAGEGGTGGRSRGLSRRA